MINEQQAGIDLIQYHNETFGKITDRYKDESWFMQFLSGVMWLFNRRFMKMITVIGDAIYWGEGQKQDVENVKWWTFKVRAHEGIHQWDAKENPTFWMLYLLPHLIGVLFWVVALTVSFFKLYFISVALYAIGAILLSPLPNWCFAAYYRAWAELRAYKVNMLINYWRYGSITGDTIEWVMKQFITGNYYWMLPLKAYMFKRIYKWVESVNALDYMLFSFENPNDILHPYLISVYKIMEKNNLVCDSVKERSKKLFSETGTPNK